MNILRELCRPWPFILDPNDLPEAERTELSRLALTALLDAVRSGTVSEDMFFARRSSGLSDLSPQTGRHWLWRMHHRHNEVWKCIGRPNWSIAAYASWHRTYWATPADRREDRRGHPRRETVPKREAGLDGLRHEHVVPMGLMLQSLLDGKVSPDAAVALNQDAIITIREDRLLDKSGHPDLSDPWVRYAGTGIRFLPNPGWSDVHKSDLERHGLVATLEELSQALEQTGSDQRREGDSR